MLTRAQIGKYRRAWGEILELLTTWGEFSKEDAEEERKEITRQTLGQDKSSVDFTNRELDKILDAFDRYRVLLTGPRNGPSREDQQPCIRLAWKIDQLGLGDPYVARIARDQFAAENWRTDLTENQLKRLLFTCTNRAARRKANPPVANPADGDPF